MSIFGKIKDAIFGQHGPLGGQFSGHKDQPAPQQGAPVAPSSAPHAQPQAAPQAQPQASPQKDQDQPGQAQLEDAWEVVQASRRASRASEDSEGNNKGASNGNGVESQAGLRGQSSSFSF